jgi:hypothetical protein
MVMPELKLRVSAEEERGFVFSVHSIISGKGGKKP